MDEIKRQTPTTTPPGTPITEDISLTPNAESEFFTSWTLVTDKNKTSAATDTVDFTPMTPEKSDEDNDNNKANHIEILTGSSYAEAANLDEITCKHETESSAGNSDDLSDGISIISESESAGRVSPHPMLRKRLSELNLKFASGDFELHPRREAGEQATPPNTPMYATCENSSQTSLLTKQQRRRRLSRDPETSSSRSRSSSLQVEVSTDTIHRHTSSLTSIRYGITGLFYVGAILAVLAFIGKLRNPEWDVLSSGITPIPALEAKLNDLELQNNLMRAEIDILTKQVNYLIGAREDQRYNVKKDKSPPQKHSNRPPQQRDANNGGGGKGERYDKTIKAWPGNGNSGDQVEITAKNLKQPFECDEGKYLDIAGMCVERTRPGNDETVADSIDEKYHKATLDDSESFIQYEKAAEELNRFIENPFGNVKNEEKSNHPPSPASEPKSPASDSASRVTKSENENYQGDRNSKFKPEKYFDKKTNDKKYNAKPPVPEEKAQKYRKQPLDSDDNSKERGKSYREKKQHHEHYHRHHHDDHDNDDDDSRESRERHDKRHKNQKNYEFEKNRQNVSGGGGGLPADGRWQDKMMKQRESSRKNKNWYFDRADGREQARFGEHRSR